MTTKCESCGKNVTEEEENQGVHLCPSTGAYTNVGNYLTVQKEKEAEAKKIADAQKKLEETALGTPKKT
jgi:ribosomal protein L37AE/L43A